MITVPARLVSWALFVGHIYWGAGYLLLPPRFYSSGSYAYVFSWAPAQVWGWLFLACAAGCLIAPWLPRGGSAVIHLAAAGVLLVFAWGFLLAAVDGAAQGWGGPVLFAGPALMHLLIVRARYQVAGVER